MKNIYMLLFCCGLFQFGFAQSNYDFEGVGTGSLDDWEMTCGGHELVNEGSAAGNEWSVKVKGGNTQGCIHSYVYTPIDYFEDAQTIYARARSIDGPAILILGKETVDNEIVELASAMTTSTEWTTLSIGALDTFELAPGETPLIMLSAGTTSGPSPEEYALFDYIDVVSLVNTSNAKEKITVKVYPNPTQEKLLVQIPKSISNPTINVFNVLGKQVCSPPFMRNTDIVSIDINNLPAGQYFVKVMDEERGRKVVKGFCGGSVTGHVAFVQRSCPKEGIQLVKFIWFFDKIRDNTFSC